MTKEQCKKLVLMTFGDEAADDDDIVSWYMEVNNVSLDETYNTAIDDAIGVVRKNFVLEDGHDTYASGIVSDLQKLKK